MSPFDKRVTSLSTPQLAWILSNYYKDKEEDFEKLKWVLYFINPEAAEKIFDPKEKVTTTSDDEAFLKEVQEHTSSKLSLKDLDLAFEKRKPIPEPEELDTIERVEE